MTKTNRLLIGGNLLASLALARFTISKFAAWPESVAGFVIGFAALSHVVNAAVLMRGKATKANRMLTLNMLWSIGAMSGALIAEFFLRSSVKWPLVLIAVGVLAVSLATLRAVAGGTGLMLLAGGRRSAPTAAH